MNIFRRTFNKMYEYAFGGAYTSYMFDKYLKTLETTKKEDKDKYIVQLKDDAELWSFGLSMGILLGSLLYIATGFVAIGIIGIGAFVGLSIGIIGPWLYHEYKQTKKEKEAKDVELLSLEIDEDSIKTFIKLAINNDQDNVIVNEYAAEYFKQYADELKNKGIKPNKLYFRNMDRNERDTFIETLMLKKIKSQFIAVMQAESTCNVYRSTNLSKLVKSYLNSIVSKLNKLEYKLEYKSIYDSQQRLEYKEYFDNIKELNEKLHELQDVCNQINKHPQNYTKDNSFELKLADVASNDISKTKENLQQAQDASEQINQYPQNHTKNNSFELKFTNVVSKPSTVNGNDLEQPLHESVKNTKMNYFRRIWNQTYEKVFEPEAFDWYEIKKGRNFNFYNDPRNRYLSDAGLTLVTYTMGGLGVVTLITAGKLFAFAVLGAIFLTIAASIFIGSCMNAEANQGMTEDLCLEKIVTDIELIKRSILNKEIERITQDQQDTLKRFDNVSEVKKTLEEEKKAELEKLEDIATQIAQVIQKKLSDFMENESVKNVYNSDNLSNYTIDRLNLFVDAIHNNIDVHINLSTFIYKDINSEINKQINFDYWLETFKDFCKRINKYPQNYTKDNAFELKVADVQINNTAPNASTGDDKDSELHKTLKRNNTGMSFINRSPDIKNQDGYNKEKINDLKKPNNT